MENNTQLNYTVAYEELQALITELDDDTISIDTLSEKVKRATELILFCKKKLTETDEEVKIILGELNAKEETATTIENDEMHPGIQDAAEEESEDIDDEMPF